MKKLVAFLVMPLFAFTLSAQDQTEPTYTDVRELLQASVDMSGGVAWDSISTIVTKSSISVDSPQGVMDGSLVMTQMYPGYLHAAVTIATPMGLLEQVQLMTPEVRYTENNFMGRQELPENPFSMLDSPSLLKNLLMHDIFELSMQDSVWQDTPVYAVTAKVDDQHMEILVEKESLRPVNRITQTAQGPVSVVYSEFTEVPLGDLKVQIPFKQVQTVAGTTQVITIAEIELNSDVDVSVFEDSEE